MGVRATGSRRSPRRRLERLGPPRQGDPKGCSQTRPRTLRLDAAAGFAGDASGDEESQAAALRALETFLRGADGDAGVKDIRLFFQTCAYSGNCVANKQRTPEDGRTPRGFEPSIEDFARAKELAVVMLGRP